MHETEDGHSDEEAVASLPILITTTTMFTDRTAHLYFRGTATITLPPSPFQRPGGLAVISQLSGSIDPSAAFGIQYKLYNATWLWLTPSAFGRGS